VRGWWRERERVRKEMPFLHPEEIEMCNKTEGIFPVSVKQLDQSIE